MVWLVLRDFALIMLSHKWGASTHDFVALRGNAGRGDAAARLIARAPRFSQAVVIFNNCRFAEHVVAADRLHAAMVDRLRHEGPTPESHQFLKDEKIDERRPVYSDDMTDEKRNYEELYQYESRVMLFNMVLEELRGDL